MAVERVAKSGRFRVPGAGWDRIRRCRNRGGHHQAHRQSATYWQLVDDCDTVLIGRLHTW